jgi:FkbM family methyltransferase
MCNTFHEFLQNLTQIEIFDRFTQKKALKRIIVTFYRLYYTIVFKSLKIRPHTSDEAMFKQIFLKREYDIPLDFTPQFIIDGGANVGYASLWFSHQFPDAKIIAVEPEESNYDVLKFNVRSNKKITPIHAALWDRRSNLIIKDTGLGECGFMVEEVASPSLHSVKGITIDELLIQFGFDHIDILKIDIEGAEKELFSTGYSQWIDKVRVIIIELHDHMKPECSDTFYSAIANSPFVESTRGENIVLIRSDKYL